jgi:hypothetical protein
MSSKHLILGTILTFTLLSFVNSTLSNTGVYQIVNKSESKCVWARFNKVILRYADCTSTTTDDKFQFTLPTDSTIVMKNGGNVLDNAVDTNDVVNWPKFTTVPDSQKWTFVIDNTASGNGVDYYTIKNVAKTKCIKYDNTIKDADGNPTVSVDTCPGASDDHFLFKFVRPQVNILGPVIYALTNAAIPTAIWQKDGFTKKITFNKPDGTAFGDAALTADSKYSIAVDPYTTYTIVPNIYESKLDSPQSITVGGTGIDAQADPTQTAAIIKLNPAQYTWKLQLTWNNKVSDLDIYIKSSTGCYYYKKSSSIINFVKDLTQTPATGTFEEIQLLPTYVDTYLVYVKNRSREAKLKDTEAKITITRSKTNGTTTVIFPDPAATVSVPTVYHDANLYYWKALTIDAKTQTYTTHDVVCADPTAAACVKA